jgi:mannose-6-phosphate isomerase class I
VIRLNPQEVHVARERRGVEILLGFEGECEIAEAAGAMSLRHGESVLVPASSGSYRLTGGVTGALVYKASVPNV